MAGGVQQQLDLLRRQTNEEVNIKTKPPNQPPAPKDSPAPQPQAAPAGLCLGGPGVPRGRDGPSAPVRAMGQHPEQRVPISGAAQSRTTGTTRSLELRSCSVFDAEPMRKLLR